MVGAAVLIAGFVAWRADTDSTRGSETSAEHVAAEYGRSFLRHYFEPDGRIVRTDEGGDVVSEGQAYGMLIAAAIGDETTFRTIWAWTRSNLTRPDGLLAWRWHQGRVADPNSASDADVDAARALVLAGERFDAPDLWAEGERLAAAVLDHETTPFGEAAVMVAGSWAMTEPQQVNVSYFSPRAEQDLSRFDPRWDAMSGVHRGVLERLLRDRPLPPDWVQLDGSSISAIGHGSAPVQFGLDAARTPIRLAESCASEDWALAATMRAPLVEQAAAVGIRHLDGSPAVEWKHPIALVALAATERAAGDEAAGTDALREAAALQQQYPTYYGAAWVALGHLMLETSMLGDCSAPST
ncbi:glycosyl hydrolase family 8 [Mycolicibacterium sp. GCM10028919]|uniref:glycosyl hydrolase family 8 n=1 Tax=Mycolicibacterium sp. GCM10028919 TaxID=3273401 RepID=UPI00361F6D72